MREVIRLIQDIRAFLSGAPGVFPAEALAPQYARWREDAANRLEACAAMLEKGSEYQALQLAEADPPLLDLVAELAFAEEPEWVDYCHRYQLAAPVRLDSRAIRSLNAIYDKGISPNSPLYRDYRSAVSSRDDDKALQIIRSISRLNPSDANAKTELDRLQNKKMLARLEDLKAALAGGDKDSVAAIVNEVEALSTPDKLARQETYVAGAAVRKAVLRTQGEWEVAELLETAGKQMNTGDWKSISVKASRIRELEKERELQLQPEQIARLLKLDHYVDKQRADAKEQVEFNQVLDALSANANMLDTRLLTAATLTLAEAQELEASFAEKWKRVERYHRTVPPGELARLQGVGAAIRREASRLRRGRKTRRFVLAASVTVLLCAGAYAGYAAWRAHEYGQELSDLRARNLPEAAAKLVESIPGSAPPGTTAFPALRAKMEETRQWARNEQDHLRQTEALLSGLEKAAGEQFAGVPPSVLNQKLAEAKENVGRLAADLSTQSKDRLSQTQNKIDQHFTALREKNAAELKQSLADLNRTAAGFSFEQPISELDEKLASLDSKLQEIEKSLPGEVPELRTPVEIEADVKKLRDQIEPFLTEMGEFRKVSKAMADADDEDAYAQALTQFSKLRFVDAGNAAPILADLPKPDRLAAKLLFNGDDGAWAAVKADANIISSFRPADVLSAELKTLLNVRDDPMLNEIWEVGVKKTVSGRVRHLLSKGKPVESAEGMIKSFTASVYDPTSSPATAAFTDSKFVLLDATNGEGVGDLVIYSRPSPTKRFMDSLQLNHVTDANGEKYETPLLGTIDAVVRAPDGSAIAKAYVISKLYGIVKIRPYQWGVHYCPSLPEDMKALEAILAGRYLHSADWFIPDVRNQIEDKLGAFIKKISSRPAYLYAAYAYRNLAMSVRDAGISYVGYIDGTHTPHVKAKGVSAAELWAVSQRDGDPQRIAFTNGKGDEEALHAARAWSPLFSIPMDRQKALAKLRDEAKGSGTPADATETETSPTTPSPFLRAP